MCIVFDKMYIGYLVTQYIYSAIHYNSIAILSKPIFNYYVIPLQLQP
jgi:hypothetical protein